MKNDNNNTTVPAQNEQSVTSGSPSKDRPSRGLKLQSNVKAGILSNPPGIFRNSDEPDVVGGE